MKAKQIINNKINSMDSDASFGKNIVLDQEILLLQQCNYKLPIDKAKKYWPTSQKSVFKRQVIVHVNGLNLL